MNDFATVTGHGPGMLGPVVRRHPETGKRHMDQLSWGLLPHGTKHPLSAPRPIHARAETVATLPMFADAFQRRRGIAVCDEYFQRRTKSGTGSHYIIARADGQPMAIAAVWERFRWPDGEIERTYCLVTVAATGAVAEIHDRMPLVLEQADWPLWLGEEPGDPTHLLRPSENGVLICRPRRRRQRGR